jgi:uncharacterized protein (TIGR02145 family)/uncharacterized repeat protein (TIGR02543 family)
MATYTITYDANGGSGTMSSQTITANTSDTLSQNSFTRDGYAFSGWSTTADGSVAYADGVSYSIAESNVILYAQWTAVWACGNSIVDSRDNTTYGTVLIGTQCWMSKNMNIGTMVASNVTQNTNCTEIKKYCYSGNVNNCTSRGGLYQWRQAMCGSTTVGAKGICPEGWHIPTDSEYKTLEMYLGMPQAVVDTLTFRGGLSNEAFKLFATSVADGNGTNTSGFSLLMAGYTESSSYIGSSSHSYLWTSSESGSNVFTRGFYKTYASINRIANSKTNGQSVRCLMDN